MSDRTRQDNIDTSNAVEREVISGGGTGQRTERGTNVPETSTDRTSTTTGDRDTSRNVDPDPNSDNHRTTGPVGEGGGSGLYNPTTDRTLDEPGDHQEGSIYNPTTDRTGTSTQETTSNDSDENSTNKEDLSNKRDYIIMDWTIENILKIINNEGGVYDNFHITSFNQVQAEGGKRKYLISLHQQDTKCEKVILQDYNINNLIDKVNEDYKDYEIFGIYNTFVDNNDNKWYTIVIQKGKSIAQKDLDKDTGSVGIINSKIKYYEGNNIEEMKIMIIATRSNNQINYSLRSFNVENVYKLFNKVPSMTVTYVIKSQSIPETFRTQFFASNSGYISYQQKVEKDLYEGIIRWKFYTKWSNLGSGYNDEFEEFIHLATLSTNNTTYVNNQKDLCIEFKLDENNDKAEPVESSKKRWVSLDLTVPAYNTINEVMIVNDVESEEVKDTGKII